MRRRGELRCAVGRYCPLGFNATWAYLATLAPDLRTEPAALPRALAVLEESRGVFLLQEREFAARRRVEKAAGRRTPGVRGAAPCWPGTVPPSRLGLIAAVANRHTAFRSWPGPGATVEAPRLAELRARLDACAVAYLADLGRQGPDAAKELADTLDGIETLTLPGYTPLNTYLRFGRLLAYAMSVTNTPG
ncbi:hypothetical protein [Streptomyces acidiscabies]|uniref:hypothetical protein n=1 Tax=Streptomyces acidiscabies TaxID=42234 RepID=UPI00131A8946|nr:hypothetical protein [Streptomyces acidiscabies]